MTADGGWVRIRCGACGTEFIATDGSGPPPAPPEEESAEAVAKPERVFFDEEGVLVTDARFVAPGCTFAVGDVLWCTVRAVPGRWRWPLSGVLLLCLAVGMMVVGVVGVTLCFAADLPMVAQWLIGAAAFVLCGLSVWVAGVAEQHRYRRLDRYQLVVGVGGLEVEAYSDADEELVKRVAVAVAEAMFPG